MLALNELAARREKFRIAGSFFVLSDTSLSIRPPKAVHRSHWPGEILAVPPLQHGTLGSIPSVEWMDKMHLSKYHALIGWNPNSLKRLKAAESSTRWWAEQGRAAHATSPLTTHLAAHATSTDNTSSFVSQSDSVAYM